MITEPPGGWHAPGSRPNELDPATRTYLSTGAHRDTLTLASPFSITLRVAALNQARPLRFA